MEDLTVPPKPLTPKGPRTLVQNQLKLPPYEKRTCNSFLTSIFLDLTA